mmetsp:Transcript_11015/g.26939  ORF Transcript_11015/g.26939 Transcript_11015/m.26939 type:complete len:228 (-) Transcript_11015:387-1070(-)
MSDKNLEWFRGKRPGGSASMNSPSFPHVSPATAAAGCPSLSPPPPTVTPVPTISPAPRNRRTTSGAMTSTAAGVYSTSHASTTSNGLPANGVMSGVNQSSRATDTTAAAARSALAPAAALLRPRESALALTPPSSSLIAASPSPLMSPVNRITAGSSTSSSSAADTSFGMGRIERPFAAAPHSAQYSARGSRSVITTSAAPASPAAMPAKPRPVPRSITRLPRTRSG